MIVSTIYNLRKTLDCCVSHSVRLFWHSTPSSLKTSELTHINRFIFAGLTPAPCSAPLTQVTPDHWARDTPGSWTPVTPPPAPEHLRRVWVTSINHHQLARYHWSHWSKKCYRIRYNTVKRRHSLNFISDANWYPLSPSPKFIMHWGGVSTKAHCRN